MDQITFFSLHDSVEGDSLVNCTFGQLSSVQKVLVTSTGKSTVDIEGKAFLRIEIFSGQL